VDEAKSHSGLDSRPANYHRNQFANGLRLTAGIVGVCVLLTGIASLYASRMDATAIDAMVWIWIGGALGMASLRRPLRPRELAESPRLDTADFSSDTPETVEFRVQTIGS
jgi:hypothetical protein